MVNRLVLMMMTSTWVSVSILYSQPVVSIHASRLGALNQQYVAIDIEYWNKSRDTIVTYLQNWRAIGIADSGEVFGFPYVPRFINRLFILPPNGDLRSHTSRIEDNSSGQLMSNNLKLLGPGDKFHFIVLLQDSIATKSHERRNQLVFYGNYAHYSKVRRELAKLPLSKILYRDDIFIIPVLPVDRDTSWNTVSVKYDTGMYDEAPFSRDHEDLFPAMEEKFTVVSKKIVF